MKLQTKSEIFYFLEQSILAGIMIGISGTIYLMSNQSLAGVLLFSFGLLTIIIRQYYLYTGKIGIIVLDKDKILPLIEIIIGNFIGTWIVANALKFTRYKEILNEKARIIYQTKVQDAYLSLFILSVFCGILMYLAVKASLEYNHKETSLIILIVIPVTIFIICGFEHSVANMFYFNLAKNINEFSLKDFFIIFVMLLGNGMGARLVPDRRRNKNK